MVAIPSLSDRLSGAKEVRTGLNALVTDARRGVFDVVVVWRFDRFARSVKTSLCWRLRNSTPWKLTSFHIQEALETSTPMGRAMFTIIAATAELERDVIRERTTAGFEYARYHRTKSGKPIGRPRAVFRHDQVLQLHGDGTPSLERPRTPPRGAKTPQRGHFNPDRGGARGVGKRWPARRSQSRNVLLTVGFIWPIMMLARR